MTETTTKNYRFEYEGNGLSLPNGVLPPGEVIAVETNDDGMIVDPALAPFAEYLYYTDRDPTVEYDGDDLDRTAGDLPPGYGDDAAVTPASPAAREPKPVVDSSETVAAASDTTDSQTERAVSGSGSTDETADTSSSVEANTNEGATNPPAMADADADGTGDAPDLEDADIDALEDDGDRETLRSLAAQYDDIDARESNSKLADELREKKGE